MDVICAKTHDFFAASLLSSIDFNFDKPKSDYSIAYKIIIRLDEGLKESYKTKTKIGCRLRIARINKQTNK